MDSSSRFRKVDRIVTPLILFTGVYLCSFLVVAMSSMASGPRLQWLALGCVVLATVVAVALIDGGRWPIGLGRVIHRSVPELVSGAGIAVVLVGSGDTLIRAVGAVGHVRLGSLDPMLIGTFFLPAALHEELLFRGYLLQKLLTWRRGPAVIISSALFTMAHMGNSSLSRVAVVNIFLAGLLLALAYLLYRRLWLPIGIHFAWNVMSGPVLGYRVSGIHVTDTIFRSDLTGPSWITGGLFGIEGSVAMTLVEVLAIAGLALLLRKKEMLERSEAFEPFVTPAPASGLAEADSSCAPDKGDS